MSATHKGFWTRTVADRNAARDALMKAGAGWGDSTIDGITVPISTMDADAVVAAAEAHDLRETGRWYTVNRTGGTILMLDLA